MSRLTDREVSLIAAAKGRRLESNDTLVADARRFRAAYLADMIGLSALKGWFQSWRLSQQTRRELGRLSDQQLEDIGIFRGQIDNVAESLSGVANAPKVGFVEAIKLWILERHTETALQRLDSRLLRDIGVEPWAIRQIANGASREQLHREAA